MFWKGAGNRGHPHPYAHAQITPQSYNVHHPSTRTLIARSPSLRASLICAMVWSLGPLTRIVQDLAFLQSSTKVNLGREGHAPGDQHGPTGRQLACMGFPAPTDERNSRSSISSPAFLTNLLVLAQRLLVDLPSVTQHVLGEVLHAVDGHAAASQREPLHVAALWESKKL